LYVIRITETEQYTNDLDDALLKRNGKQFWRCWDSKFEHRKQTTNYVNGITDPSLIADQFVLHFSRACTNNSQSGADRLKASYEAMRPMYCGISANHCESYLFDAELVECTIAKMKRGKAAGLDGICVEHLLFSHPVLPCIFAKLFNLMITHSHVPDSFGMSYTVPILKANCNMYGKPLTVDDFRGISISPVLSKVLEHCILDRYGDFFVTSNHQFGFKKHSSCAHAIYITRCVVDYYTTHGSTVNLCAIDLSKAFDKMNHHGLFIRLMERKIPANLLSLLENWFSIGITCVKLGNLFSRFFDLKCGIRQGGVLSPTLFAVYIDSLVDKVSASKIGCYVKWTCISILLYADDILLIAPSLTALQQILLICEAEIEAMDMSINVKKSYCLRIGPRFNANCANVCTKDGSIY